MQNSISIGINSIKSRQNRPLPIKSDRNILTVRNKAALAQLRAAVGDTDESGNTGSDGSNGTSGNDQGQSGQNQNGQIIGSAEGNKGDASGKDNVSAKADTAKNSSAQKSVKTGDTAAPIAGAAAGMMLAAAAGVMAYRRRRETR